MFPKLCEKQSKDKIQSCKVNPGGLKKTPTQLNGLHWKEKQCYFQEKKHIHPILALALARWLEALCYSLSFSVLPPGQSAFSFHWLPSRKKSASENNTATQPFNVLHRCSVFFLLHPIKVYSAVTQIFVLPLSLMEANVSTNIHPLQRNTKEGKVEGGGIYWRAADKSMSST